MHNNIEMNKYLANSESDLMSFASASEGKEKAYIQNYMVKHKLENMYG
jgi:hypothetical protein